MKGYGDGREGAGCQRNVGRFERQADLLTNRVGQVGTRRLLARLVGEPILVLRQGRFLDRRDKARERHFVRVAEREVRDAGVLAPLRVTRIEEELRYSVECAARRGTSMRDDRQDSASDQFADGVRVIDREIVSASPTISGSLWRYFSGTPALRRPPNKWASTACQYTGLSLGSREHIGQA